ncbi:MAG: endoglycoceramidase, partial [Mycobacteriaceae bacterium]
CDDPTTADQQAQGLVDDPTKPPTPDNVNTEKLAILSVPHPRSVAGIPQKYGFDRATSTFTLQYSSMRASGEGAFPAGAVTTIATPPGQYPHGYQVTARGAQVVSTANAPVLALAADPGATTIDVAVRPA